MIAAVVAGLIGFVCAMMLAWVEVKEGVVVATCVGAVVGMCWGLARVILNSAGASQFTSSAVRSFVPVLGVAALVLTAVVAPVLMWMEASAVRRISDPAAGLLINEINRSDLRQMREWIVNGQ